MCVHLFVDHCCVNVYIRVLNSHGWSQPQNHFNSEIFPVYSIDYLLCLKLRGQRGKDGGERGKTEGRGGKTEGRGEINRTEGEVREGWGRKGSDQKEGKGKGGKVEDERKNGLT